MPSVVTRYPGNPILRPGDLAYPSTQLFTAGVARFGRRYVMVFRNDWADPADRGRVIGTNLGLATSDDGIRWTPEPQPCWEWRTDEIMRVYDPRLTVIDDRCFVCFAVDTRHGLRGGVAVADDFRRFEILSLSVPDNRNMVLFPERIGGKLARLERPFPVYSRGVPEDFDIWYSQSPDGRYWGDTELVLGREHVPWANSKIGPGAPPLRTDRGWLTLFHAVDQDPKRTFCGWERNPWRKRYTIGLMLLDLHQPWRVIGFCRQPLMIPETAYELDGFRGSVLFPGGLILEDDGTVKIYYGAADTVEALATARLGDLLDLCQPI